MVGSAGAVVDSSGKAFGGGPSRSVPPVTGGGSAGFAGISGAASNPRECVSRGAAAGCGVGGGAERAGGSVGYQNGDGGMGGEEVLMGEEMRG